ncbi:Gluconate 2-dehydrogenase flavoprotein [Fibrella aestuarina BUZ 2]|uniref:Gluconate 2-dehydrogenase flavoprotein n=1 Tax=Fibrella aestuarina BUZ 2 TaxID=1166018 RepID=I0K5L7_9BACT|nr:GMC family oxidoreductase [Fibrella aestuarina]CCG99420.1 Gluconate 2-dehydrogenase flavoprotein [Fibrella aestuarina BUZ 2]
MATFNIDSKKRNTYDAIVIGSGISGGWAAKELCEKGLKTLVLERGRDVKHIADYPTAMLNPWELPHRGQVPLEVRNRYSSRSFMREETLHWAIKPDEQPIIEEQPFTWTRGYHVGGKSLLWARQTQRWSDFDFDGPARDGFAIDWPIRYKDLAPWYSHVEKFAGISGNKDGLDVLPDGEFLPPFELSCVEQHLKASIDKNYKDRHFIQGRAAHITDPQAIHGEQGRAKCQHRALCVRGCPYGGYFSSNASTLPWAARTGKLTLRPHSVVQSVIYDEVKKKAVGVRIIDANSLEPIEYFANIIFVNASAINSNAILLNSQSGRFPNGLGNDNGLMGKYLSWHNYRGKANAEFDGLQDKRTDGKNPSNGYMPRFRNVYKQETTGPASQFLRGYAIGIGGGRGLTSNRDGLGDDLKAQLLNPHYGNWNISAWMMGECVPIEENHVRLSTDQTDKYGIPQIILSAKWTDNDARMVQDFNEQITEMFTLAGFKNVRATDTKSNPGSDIHEMGGVRMGKDPKTSLLNEWNQLHACKNVFVTDGASMTSTGTQNPSLTYMALTARAVDHAVKELKKRNL